MLQFQELPKSTIGYAEFPLTAEDRAKLLEVLDANEQPHGQYLEHRKRPAPPSLSPITLDKPCDKPCS